MENYVSKEEYSWSKEHLNKYLDDYDSNIDKEFLDGFEHRVKSQNLKPHYSKYKNMYNGMLNECKLYKFLQILSNNNMEKFKLEGVDDEYTPFDYINHKNKEIYEVKSLSYTSYHQYPDNFNKYGDYCYWFAKHKIDMWESKISEMYPDYKLIIYFFFTDKLCFTEYSYLNDKYKNEIKSEPADKSDPTAPKKRIVSYLYPKKHFLPFTDKLTNSYDECLL
tara:strand:- start:822 stop:1484 length:663 start_codon:yes stop_codon:yes gene_type:complete